MKKMIVLVLALLMVIGSSMFLLQQLGLHITGLFWRHEIPPRSPTRSHESSAR
jgi:uncharacterized protein YxeA